MRTLAPARRLTVAAGCWLRSLHAFILQSTQVIELLRQILLLGPAALPAVTPIEDEELKAERINLDGWLKANAQVVVVHFVELRARVQETDVAGDGEK